MLAMQVHIQHLGIGWYIIRVLTQNMHRIIRHPHGGLSTIYLIAIFLTIATRRTLDMYSSSFEF